MVIDHLVGYRQQQALIAIAAFDPWLVTHACPPLIAAGGRIACPPLGRLPADWINILPPSKQAPKQCDLFCGGKLPSSGFVGWRDDGFYRERGIFPFDAVLGQQGLKPEVLSLEGLA
jgi:hypothetical protein